MMSSTKYKPPDIRKCQKKRKNRKRMSDLNSRLQQDEKEVKIYMTRELNLSNEIQCKSVSTLTSCSNAISHQMQSISSNSISSITKNSLKTLKNVSNNCFTEVSIQNNVSFKRKKIDF